MLGFRRGSVGRSALCDGFGRAVPGGIGLGCGYWDRAGCGRAGCGRLGGGSGVSGHGRPAGFRSGRSLRWFGGHDRHGNARPGHRSAGPEAGRGNVSAVTTGHDRPIGVAPGGGTRSRLTTRQIAQAARIGEGTMFRVLATNKELSATPAVPTTCRPTSPRSRSTNRSPTGSRVNDPLTLSFMTAPDGDGNHPTSPSAGHLRRSWTGPGRRPSRSATVRTTTRMAAATTHCVSAVRSRPIPPATSTR